MTGPIGIQQRRVKGWRMPPNTVSVARPGRWGNTYRVGDPDPVTGSPMTAEAAVFWFEADLDPLISASAEAERDEIRKELRGKNLACFCGLDQPCHRSVLLRIANSPDDPAKEAA